MAFLAQNLEPMSQTLALIVHSVVTLFNAFGTWRVRVQIQAFLCSSTKSDTIPVAKLVDYMNDHQVRPYIEKMLQEY